MMPRITRPRIWTNNPSSGRLRATASSIISSTLGEERWRRSRATRFNSGAIVAMGDAGAWTSGSKMLGGGAPHLALRRYRGRRREGIGLGLLHLRRRPRGWS